MENMEFYLRFIDADDLTTSKRDDIKLSVSPYVLKLSLDEKFLMIMGINGKTENPEGELRRIDEDLSLVEKYQSLDNLCYEFIMN